jgi:hypothetical protein
MRNWPAGALKFILWGRRRLPSSFAPWHASYTAEPKHCPIQVAAGMWQGIALSVPPQRPMAALSCGTFYAKCNFSTHPGLVLIFI